MFKHSINKVYLFALALFLAGCEPLPDYETTSEWTVHNPLDEAVGVLIDGKGMKLEPQSSQTVTLQAGKHTIETGATGEIEFMVYINAKGGLINPTLSTYIVESVSFTREGTDGSFDARGDNNQVISVAGHQFKGAYSLHKDLFIDKNWAYGLGEAVPDEISADSQLPGGFLNKLYSQAEFLQAANLPASLAEPTMMEQHPELPVIPVFETPALEQAAKTYRAALNTYYLAAEAEAQSQAKEAADEASTTLVEAGKKAGDAVTEQDVTAYNVFRSTLNYPGALVLPKAQ
jgi:hypothetical protein